MSNAQLARLLPTALSVFVSLVSLRMAVKGLSAKEWLPFHEAAAAADWSLLTPRLRLLLLFMVRMAGLGFLVLFLLLATVPVYLAWNPDPMTGLAIFGIGIIYCVGLGILTRWLHRKTGAGTPWKESFGAAGVLALAALLSVVAR
jgi:hypothetical protein